MNTPIIDRVLIKEPPQSLRERIGGFAIRKRTPDKIWTRVAEISANIIPIVGWAAGLNFKNAGSTQLVTLVEGPFLKVQGRRTSSATRGIGIGHCA